LQFLIKQIFHLYFYLSSVFGHQNSGSGLDQYPDPDSLEMLGPDPDPQLCFADMESKSLTMTILTFADLMGL
jgi:hypothetical protein